MIKLSSSILAADPMKLGEAAQMAHAAGCDELHFDVMDGHFVPNLTFGPYILAAMKKQTPDIVYDVHLMLTDPLDFVDGYAEAGADIITVHVEANDWLEAAARIRAHNLKAGVSLKPGTPVDVLRPYLRLFDRVLLMTVEPGFGGQKLMPAVLQKAGELREMGFQGDIEADGGISPKNMTKLTEAGVEVLVMGTGFFLAENPKAVVEAVHAL